MGIPCVYPYNINISTRLTCDHGSPAQLHVSTGQQYVPVSKHTGQHVFLSSFLSISKRIASNLFSQRRESSENTKINQIRMANKSH